MNKGTGKRLNPFQAVRKRPDWAIGSPLTVKDDKWIFSEENKTMIVKNITFNSGLFNIIREIGSNAIDNKWRSEQAQDDNENDYVIPLLKRIDFKVNIETGEISICNDGYQIPVEKQEFEYTDHRTNKTIIEEMYPAEIYFGDMFSGTNYDDLNEEDFVKEISKSKGRKTSGRNGMGAKAANIFSTSFTVEHTDTINKKKFIQTFRNGGQERDKPKVTSYRNKNGYTKITFTPDYKYFKFPNAENCKMTNNLYLFLKGYAYEIAMVTGVNVYFNEEKIMIKTLERYARLYYPNNKMCSLITPNGDELLLVEQHETEDESIDTVLQTSFINGIQTSRGGKYVEMSRDAIFSTLVRLFNSRKKKVEGKQLKTTAKKLYPYFHLFVRCEAIEPSFDSQTKEYCLSKINFYDTSNSKDKTQWTKTLEDCSNKILKWGFVSLLEEKLLSEIDKSNDKKEKISSGRLIMGKKLTEANKRRNEPLKCIMCITEGDSAKTLVTRGSNNPDYIGSFAIRGKFLNVSKATSRIANANKEIQSLKQILGLKSKIDYTNNENFKTLRYGKVWLMTDADSVSGNTPLLLRKNGKVVIKTIESLIGSNEYDSRNDNSKEYINNSENYEVWTENGWTTIRQVIRHKVHKRMYRVHTFSGFVEVTEDHSLLSKTGEEISPKTLELGTRLMISFPEPNYTNDVERKPEITNDEAYELGLHWNNEEIIPEDILNSPVLTRKNYYNGICTKYAATVITRNSMIEKITVHSTVVAHSLYYLIRSLGYDVTVDYFEDNAIVLYVYLSYINQDTTNVIRITDLGIINDYVYDLETENHHFQAGVGDLIVHNTDGIHIRGLLLNFFFREYPSLLQRNYVAGFNTAIVQLWYKVPKQKALQTKRFFTNTEYLNWLESNEYKRISKSIKETKYYKGLGTIEPKEASNYFKEPKIVEYESEKKTSKTMELGFGDKQQDKDDRKKWIKKRLIQEREGEEFEDMIYEGKINLDNFVNDQLILYHKESIRRAIPCLYDGLKDCQRKALYSTLKRKYSKQVKLVIAAGNVIADTAYHHGDTSLKESMIKMGQGFVGANNIPYFVNAGEYGSRLLGTSDSKTHAADRYLYFKLEDVIKTIFPEEDFDLYTQLEEDGESIEYSYFLPVIPMLLVNGANGIASGFSSDIPSYDPEELVVRIRDWIDDSDNLKDSERLVPWYNNYKGKIYLKDIDTDKPKWVSEGILEKGTGKKVNGQNDKGWYHIRELPVGMWTSDFKLWLDYLELGTSPEGKSWKKLNTKCLNTVLDYNRANSVHFMIKPSKEFIPDINTKGNMDNLRQEHSLSNMVAIDENDIPYRFKSPEEILVKYCEKRLDLYDRRRKYFLKVYKKNLNVASNKYRFVKAVVDKELDMYQLPEPLEENMLEIGLEKLGEEGEESFDYLLSMAMRSMTKKRMEELEKEVEKWKNSFKILKGKTPGDLWNEDLDRFEIAYKKFLKTRCEE